MKCTGAGHKCVSPEDDVSGCPIFRSNTPGNRQGNLWPVAKLDQGKLAALPQASGKDDLVVLTMFQSCTCGPV